jgi:signal peptidase I
MRAEDSGLRANVSGLRADFKKSTLREYFESIVIAVILALFIRTFVVQAFKIPTGSMEETLLIGDHLLVNKFVFGPAATGVERALLPIGTIKRRDVLVFKYPEEPARDFIKRVIGLPGDTVWADGGSVFVNGDKIAEPYLTQKTRDFPHTKVPAGSLFVMGDNRGNSSDSRFSLGFVPENKVIGKAFLLIWPPGRAGLLH